MQYVIWTGREKVRVQFVNVSLGHYNFQKIYFGLVEKNGEDITILQSCSILTETHITQEYQVVCSIRREL